MEAYVNRYAIIALLLFLINSLSAQNKLNGLVVDEHTHEKLIGVNIIIVGTAIGTSTNTEGEFTLSGIPDGTQSIKFSHNECF